MVWDWLRVYKAQIPQISNSDARQVPDVVSNFAQFSSGQSLYASVREARGCKVRGQYPDVVYQLSARIQQKSQIPGKIGTLCQEKILLLMDTSLRNADYSY